MKQLDERVRASEGDNLGGDLIAPAHASTRVPGAVEGKHTPGPWSVEGPDCFSDYNILPPKDGTGALCGVVNNGRPNDEVEANARLIAAAPDLLAACKLAAQHHQGFNSEPGKALRAAINKAKNPV